MYEALYTFGWGRFGQCGHGDEANVVTPRPIDQVLLQGQTVAQVSCGFCYNIALTKRGDLYTWGNGRHYQLGFTDSNRDHQSIPRKLKFFQKKAVKCVAAGREHSVAVLTTGEVFTWGNGSYGRLGHGDQVTHAGPTLVNFFTTGRLEEPHDTTTIAEEPEDGIDDDFIVITQVECGAHHTLALDSKGRVYSWGLGQSGRLGHGDEDDQFTPKCIKALCRENIEIALVRCGWYHSAVVTAGRGHIYTFGCGRNHQLGGVGLGGDKENFMTAPTRLQMFHAGGKRHHVRRNSQVVKLTGSAVPKIVDLSCGGKHNLALTEDGEIYSWGCGLLGRLGLGDQRYQKIPTMIDALEEVRITSVAAGGYHSLALSEDGTIYAFGQNEQGRLGLNESTELYITKPTPIPLTKASNKQRQPMTKIFAGAYVSCAFGEVSMEDARNKKSCSIQ